MYEDRPLKDTPNWITDELAEYSGLSPDGQPIWRLVLAENCRSHCFGSMNHIDPALIQNMTDETRPTDIVPDRIEEGEFWVPKYRQKGWILQRWFAASAWGSRNDWESQKAKDGCTRLLASFPQRGDYVMMPCGPWNSLPSIGPLKYAIRSFNLQQKNNPANWSNDTQAYIAFDNFEREQAKEKFSEELEAQYRVGVSSMLRTVSGAAQRVRNEISAVTAGGVNLGGAEKWG
jgi:hypothetical protein